MLKKFLTLFAVILLVSSCHTKSKTDDLTVDENKPAASPEVENKDSYQTIENQQQADAINQQAPAQEIEVQDRVFFSYDSSQLTDEAKKILDTQVAWLKSDAAIKITVEGHCDERGTREYNIALGERRANSAKNYLVSNGVDAARVKIVSYGKERPAFFGDSEEVHAKNRRAVVVVN